MFGLHLASEFMSLGHRCYEFAYMLTWCELVNQLNHVELRAESELVNQLPAMYQICAAKITFPLD